MEDMQLKPIARADIPGWIRSGSDMRVFRDVVELFLDSGEDAALLDYPGEHNPKNASRVQSALRRAGEGRIQVARRGGDLYLLVQ